MTVIPTRPQQTPIFCGSRKTDADSSPPGGRGYGRRCLTVTAGSAQITTTRRQALTVTVSSVG